MHRGPSSKLRAAKRHFLMEGLSWRTRKDGLPLGVLRDARPTRCYPDPFGRASRGGGPCAARGTAPRWSGCGARLGPGGAGPPRRGDGVGGAAACDIEGGVAVKGSWRAAAVTLRCRGASDLARKRLVPFLLLGTRRSARGRGSVRLAAAGFPPSSARGCAPRRFFLTSSSLRWGVLGRRSSSFLVHRDGVVAMDSG